MPLATRQLVGGSRRRLRLLGRLFRRAIVGVAGALVVGAPATGKGGMVRVGFRHRGSLAPVAERRVGLVGSVGLVLGRPLGREPD